MAFYKVSLFFEGGGQGWSESYYTPDVSPTSIEDEIKALGVKRSNMNGNGVKITAARLSVINEPRRSRTVSLDIGRDAGVNAQDNLAKPFVRVQCDLRAGNYVGRHFFAGLPQSDILGDKPLNVSPAVQKIVNAYISYLVSKQYRLRATGRFDDDIPKGEIQTFGFVAPYTWTTKANHGLNPGDKVLIKGVKTLQNTPGTKFNGNGIFQVLATPLATTFTLEGWTPNGSYLSDGTFKKQVILFPVITGGQLVREMTHAVGRPFGQSAGRRKARQPR